jgi:hypothetical protein
MINELVGDVTKGLVTLVTVIEKFVPAFVTDVKSTLIDFSDIIKHEVAMPDAEERHVDVVPIEVYKGKFMITYEPEIKLLTDTNHSV